MLTSAGFVLALLAGSVAAKTCVNLTIPIDISSRNGVFNIAVPQSNLDSTTFIQNVTQQGRNFTETALSGYATVSGHYKISAQFCKPSVCNTPSSTLQILTHGIGFDKTYWDNSYHDFNYSYVNVATDEYKYCTFAFDRLGIGNSSHGEPLNEIQSFLEVSALAELTNMLRNGTVPGISDRFSKIIHVGHSFGSAETYSLVNMYPDISDGIVLTGFSLNASFTAFFAAGADFQQANLNQPIRFGNTSAQTVDSVLAMIGRNPSDPSTMAITEAYGLTDYIAGLVPGSMPVEYVNGYLANSNVNSQQYLFLLPGYFDTGLLYAGELSKQPVTVGELLTLSSVPMMNNFAGPVLIVTGSNDVPYCGGNCLATGNPAVPSIPSTVAKAFPNVGANNFEAYIQPNSGHGINFHYNATGAYKVIQNYLSSKGL
ncbi:hypothetical protein ACLMJK_003799 [Lecanora helva]